MNELKEPRSQSNLSQPYQLWALMDQRSQHRVISAHHAVSKHCHEDGVVCISCCLNGLKCAAKCIACDIRQILEIIQVEYA